jgi:MFS superfamily sulfate permease-like transporter
MSGKQIGAAVGLVFAVTLGVVVGKQLTTEAMAVVVGVVCGVAAGIPTSFLLFVVLTRREASRAEREQETARSGRPYGSYPPVVVIQGGAPQPQQPMLPGGYWPTSQQGPLVNRQFNVVGGEELYLGDDRRQ